MTLRTGRTERHRDSAPSKSPRRGIERRLALVTEAITPVEVSTSIRMTVGETRSPHARTAPPSPTYVQAEAEPGGRNPAGRAGVVRPSAASRTDSETSRKTDAAMESRGRTGGSDLPFPVNSDRTDLVWTGTERMAGRAGSADCKPQRRNHTIADPRKPHPAAAIPPIPSFPEMRHLHWTTTAEHCRNSLGPIDLQQRGTLLRLRPKPGVGTRFVLASASGQSGKSSDKETDENRDSPAQGLLRGCRQGDRYR